MRKSANVIMKGSPITRRKGIVFSQDVDVKRTYQKAEKNSTPRNAPDANTVIVTIQGSKSKNVGILTFKSNANIFEISNSIRSFLFKDLLVERWLHMKWTSASTISMEQPNGSNAKERTYKGKDNGR